MAEGSRSRRRTHVRITWDLYDLVRELMPRTPVVIRRKFMPALHVEFNDPLTEEEKEELKHKIRLQHGRRVHVRIWDEKE